MVATFTGTATSYFGDAVGGWGQVLISLLIIVAIAGLVAFTIYYIKNKKKFKINVRIFRRIGNRWFIIEEKGASLKKNGIEYLKLKKLKKPLPFPDLSNFLSGNKAKGYIHMIQTSIGRIEPLKLDIHNPSHILEAERDQSNWDMWYVSVGEVITKSFAWRDTLLKWLPYIGAIMLVIGAIVIIAVTSQQLAPVADAIGKHASEMGKFTNQLAQLVGEEAGGSGW